MRIAVALGVFVALISKSGRVLADADIRALADEAERGYDVSHLVEKQKQRGAS